MRRMQRIVLLTTLAFIMPVLAGCADFDLDKLDVFHLNEKKKLPGDRQPVFPEGVPGVTQGVPQEYIKGNQPPPENALLPLPDATPKAEQQQAAAPAEEPKPAPKPKAAAKPKPKKTVKRAAPKPKPQAAPVQPVTQQAAPAATPAPWPAPAQASGSNAPWPAAPPPGTFTR